VVLAGLLSAADASPGDLFGSAVAIDGLHGLVGAPGRGEPVPGSGVVFAFRRGGGNWTQTQKLLAPAPHPQASFGAAVALDGELVLVGAPGARVGSLRCGAAYLFRHEAGGWRLARTLYSSAPREGARFGHSVALRGGVAAVGSPKGNHAGVGSGRVHLFELASGAPAQLLVGSEAQADELFGWQVALEGSTLAVGAPGNATQGPWSGATYLFERARGGWVERGLLRPDDVGPSAFFGCALSLDGPRIAVGSYGESTVELFSGATYLYRRRRPGPAAGEGGGGWTLEQKLKAQTPRFGAQFGRSLYLWGESLAIGARLDAALFPNGGRVHSLRREEAGWVEREVIDEPTPGFNHWFGAAIAGDQGDLLVGSPHASLETEDTGAVHAFSLQPGEAFCSGDGSAADCPCGNLGPFGSGCGNSTGNGAQLLGAGSRIVTLDDLELLVSGLPAGRNALLVVGGQVVAGGLGEPLGGDGLRCLSGPLVPLGVRRTGPGGDALWRGVAGSLAAWPLGDGVHFQVLYRDPPTIGPCSGGFNSTNAYYVELLP